jgi:hypothetical protein
VWTDAVLPNGSPYGPVVGPVSATLPAGAVVTRTLSQSVPGSTPPGNYLYRAHVGPTLGSPYASASFPFTKLAARRAEAATARGTDAWAAADAVTGLSVEATWTADEPEAPSARATPPAGLRLDPVYPNPFRGGATVRFGVPEAGPVRVELYDGLGRRVRVLYDGLAPGGTDQEVALDGADLPSGVYLVRLVGETGTVTRRVLRVR